ncbi:MAG: 2-oxoacid:acceptor oxidoreductase family protein [Clostridia bacterium]|nr:2-oxoacid:acceptor oxidoreductase family protein [Clostridia bacterium]
MSVQQEIIIAGFGGQGILSAGRLIAYAGMLDNKNVSWLPSYGPEMRGGTANCHVIVSDEPVGSPILNKATSIIVMNGPSLDKFEGIVSPGGLVITDSSLVGKSPKRTDVDVSEIPASRIASEMGNATYASIILLGKLVAKTGVISKESFEEALKEVLPPKYHHLIPEEMKAFELGMNY